MMVPATPKGSRPCTSSQSIEGKGFNITLPAIRKIGCNPSLHKRSDQTGSQIPSSIWWQPTTMPKYVEVHSGYEPIMHLKTACRLGSMGDRFGEKETARTR
jgi:hypothetical protein